MQRPCVMDECGKFKVLNEGQWALAEETAGGEHQSEAER